MAGLWDSRDLERAEHIVEHARRSIRDIAGTAAYDALEGAFLDRDRPPLNRPDARAWTLAECLSSGLLLRMPGKHRRAIGRLRSDRAERDR